MGEGSSGVWVRREYLGLGGGGGRLRGDFTGGVVVGKEEKRGREVWCRGVGACRVKD